MTAHGRKILFVCDDGTHRSFIAGSLAKHLWKDAIDVEMAALVPESLHKGTLDVLKRNSVAPINKVVRQLSSFNLGDFTAVVTLSGLAEEETPEPPSKTQKFFWSLPNAAQFRGSNEQVQEMFERVFIEIEGNLKEITKYVLPN